MTAAEVDLGHRLAMARHARKLSQGAVAKAVGITQKHLSQVERGHVPMESLASGTVVRFARLFSVSTDYLLGLTNAETPPASQAAGAGPPA
jgi:transcriptional regulator with XRE-family HTH domain